MGEDLDTSTVTKGLGGALLTALGSSLAWALGGAERMRPVRLHLEPARRADLD